MSNAAQAELSSLGGSVGSSCGISLPLTSAMGKTATLISLNTIYYGIGSLMES